MGNGARHRSSPLVTVLGVYWVGVSTIHGTCAVLVRDGKVLAAVSEERITGVKHDGRPPVNAIKEVLRVSEVNPSNVDAVAVPFRSRPRAFACSLRFLLNPSPANIKGVIKGALSLPFSYASVKLGLKTYLRRLGLDCPIYFVRHHLAHAASAYYLSGFKESSVMVLDGLGDQESCTVWKGEDGTLRKFASTDVKGSLGVFYAMLTQAVGFNMGDGEGKNMALAPYGDPGHLLPTFSSMIRVDGLTLRGSYGGDEPAVQRIDALDGEAYMPYRYTYYPKNPFHKFLKDHPREDMAAAGQVLIEELGVKLAKNIVRATRIDSICMAGGVAFNVKMNKRIREAAGVKDLFVQPAAGDEGATLGAALEVCRDLMLKRGKELPLERLSHLYFGPSYTKDEIESEIEDLGLEFQSLEDPASTAAELITEGEVIGWFQGRMEFGPRALGNRSVLADPRKTAVKERINLRLKRREWFMPFAPSLLTEDAEQYFEKAVEAPFMIMAFDVKPERVEEIPAVVHIDGTARPQTVREEVNPYLWRAIKRFRDLTGVPALLNTSFNRHGLPIVMKPKDALTHLLWGCVDSLIIDRFLVRRVIKI